MCVREREKLCLRASEGECMYLYMYGKGID